MQWIEEIFRVQKSVIGMCHLEALSKASKYLVERDITNVVQPTVFNMWSDVLCVSRLTAGVETLTRALSKVKDAVPETPVFANTGVRLANVVQQLSVGDRAIIGTYFKRDGYIWNEVDEARVKELMGKVKTFRKDGRVIHLAGV
ncbi:MAG: hypothetical protein IT308_08430 [Anaerolineaceae bacterium]|nr:hypothetical protein [Anaerolineaceae bacterium]